MVSSFVGNYPGQAEEAFGAGLNEGGAISVNNATFRQITPLNDYVQNELLSQGGVYTASDKLSSVGWNLLYSACVLGRLAQTGNNLYNGANAVANANGPSTTAVPPGAFPGAAAGGVPLAPAPGIVPGLTLTPPLVVPAPIAATPPLVVPAPMPNVVQADTPNDALINPAPGSLTDIQARDWYNARLAEIDQTIEALRVEGAPLEQIAHTAHELRNEAKMKARALMQNQELAQSLPLPLTWEQAVEKYGGDFEAIITGSRRSNPDVNRAIEERRASGEQ